MHHILTSFFCHHFSTLFRPDRRDTGGDSAVDLQGDHTDNVSQQHYGNSSFLARDMVSGNPDAFIWLSQIHHATLGIGPIDPLWTDDEL